MNYIVSLICYGLTIIGKAFVFKKMDIEMWKAFIPIYSEHILFSKVWNVRMFIYYLATSLIAYCFINISLIIGHPTLNTIFLVI